MPALAPVITTTRFMTGIVADLVSAGLSAKPCGLKGGSPHLDHVVETRIVWVCLRSSAPPSRRERQVAAQRVNDGRVEGDRSAIWRSRTPFSATFLSGDCRIEAVRRGPS